MAIAVSGVAASQVEVSLRAKPEALLACSPKGTVPVLLFKDGRVIEQSLEIMHWALHQHDPEAWISNLDAGLIQACDAQFKPLLDRYKYATRHPELSLEQHRENAFSFIEMLSNKMLKTPYLCGATANIVDHAVFPFVRQFAQVNRPWFDQAAHQNLNSWLRSLEQSAAYLTAMQPSAS